MGNIIGRPPFLSRLQLLKIDFIPRGWGESEPLCTYTYTYIVHVYQSVHNTECMVTKPTGVSTLLGLHVENEGRADKLGVRKREGAKCNINFPKSRGQQHKMPLPVPPPNAAPYMYVQSISTLVFQL